MSDERTMQELIGAINALRESVDALTHEARLLTDDEDEIGFEPDFPLNDRGVN